MSLDLMIVVMLFFVTICLYFPLTLIITFELLTPPQWVNFLRFFGSWQKKKKKKKICIECHCQKEASLLPFQLLPCPSIVLRVLENDADKGKTWETTKYKLSKAVIQNCIYGTYAVLPIWGVLVSMVHTLYRLTQRGLKIGSSYRTYITI